MLKYLFVGVLVSISSLACKFKEAQVTIKIDQVTTDSMSVCKAVVEPSNIKHYQVNGNYGCGLSMETVIENGVDFPLLRGHDCEVPSTIRGVLLYDGIKITLEP